MESPIKEYRRLLNIDNIKQVAYDTLFTKYIVENLSGPKKLWEIDSTDQETLAANFNAGYPVPGFMYTFIYPPKNAEEIVVKDAKTERVYKDYVPMFFCTGFKDKKYIRGINLNALPNLERVKFLETYYRMYQDFFKDIEILTQNDKLALNMQYISLAMSPTGYDIVKLFNDITNAKFNYGFRTYNLDHIKRFRMVEYSEWNYIPHYEPKDAFKMMNQKQIHDFYWKSK